MVWIVAGILAGLVIFDLLLHVVYGAVMLRSFERKLPFDVESHAPDADAEQIEFETTGGLTLRGSLYTQQERPARGLVIFCPELGGNHWSAGWYARGLFEAGFALLAFDFRNQGDSDVDANYDPLHWLTEFEVDDVQAAVAYSRTRDDLKDLPVGLLGISRGGGAALTAATRCPEVECVATEGAFSTGSLFLHFTLRWAVLYVPEWLLKLLPLWHIKLTIALTRRVAEWRRGCRYARLEPALPELRNRPTLLIAGERDSYVHPDIARRLNRQIGEGPHEVWLVPGAKHNMARHVDSDAYDAKLAEFFSQMAVEPVGQETVGRTDSI